MKALTKLFLAGLVAVVPVAVTIAFLVWLGTVTEALLGGLMQLLLPVGFYWPGMGILAGIGVVLAVGVLTHTWLFQKLLELGEWALNRIPLVKTMYGALSDLMGFLAARDQKRFSRVVLIQFEQPPMRLMGFVTRDDFTNLNGAMGDDQTIAVYLPMSYQIGGYTALVPRSSVTVLDMPLEEAMRFAVTAGMSAAPARDGAARPSPGPART